jgi:hypothetical protein
MARVDPFRRIEIDLEICKKVERIMDTKRYRGSFTSYVESILEQYADGLLVSAEAGAEDGKVVQAVRVRRVSGAQARKSA